MPLRISPPEEEEEEEGTANSPVIRFTIVFILSLRSCSSPRLNAAASRNLGKKVKLRLDFFQAAKVTRDLFHHIPLFPPRKYFFLSLLIVIPADFIIHQSGAEKSTKFPGNKKSERKSERNSIPFNNGNNGVRYRYRPSLTPISLHRDRKKRKKRKK